MSQVILRWPGFPSRPWVRERVLATLKAGRCLLFPHGVSAGRYGRAVQGDGWAYIDTRGRVEMHDSTLDLAHAIVCRHSVEAVRLAMQHAWRHELAASAIKVAEREALWRQDEAQRREGERLNRNADRSTTCR